MDDRAESIRALASAGWPSIDWDSAEMRFGAFHTVAIPAEGPVLRVTVGDRFAERTRRETRVLRLFGGRRVLVPTPELVAGPVVEGDRAATLITRVPGVSAEPTASTARIASYAEILAAFAALNIADFATLPAPRSWCGGADWPMIVAQELCPLLDRPLRRTALVRVEATVTAKTPEQSVVCHGDFGPHNILWAGDRPAGLIDLDHACIADPAIDVAPLIGFHGARSLTGTFGEAVVRRAMVHRATLSLQVAAAAQLNGATELRDHALKNFTERCHQDTLFDPDGLTPSDVREV